MDAELAHPIPARAVPLPLRLLGDERLARLVGSGHEEAFAVLYQRHHQALYRYCRSLVGTDADAHDALQSAMTGALVALRASRRDAPIRPWLFRIAYNESMTQLRRRRPVAELTEELPALEGSPESVLEQRTRISRLLGDLRELPERQRGALVMKEMSGLSHQEVAEALGLSIGAAKQTVFEARRSLQEFDEGRAMACEDIRRLISDGDRRSLRGRRIRAHLRDCAGCSAFVGAITQRQADLRAVAPALPAVTAAGLLMRITGAGSGQGGGGSAGVIGATTGKAVAVGASGKLVATGALIVATAAVGTGGILHAVSHPSASRPHQVALGPPAALPRGATGAAGGNRPAAAARPNAYAKPAAGHMRTEGRSGTGMRTHRRHGASAVASHGRGSAGHAWANGHTNGHGTHGAAASSAAGGQHLGTQKSSSGKAGGISRPAHPTSSNSSHAASSSASAGSGHRHAGSRPSATAGNGGSGGRTSAHRTSSRASSLVRSATGTLRRKTRIPPA